jgi:uncharacterized protein (AIM24 family)
VNARSLVKGLAFIHFTPKDGDGLVSFAQMIPGEIKTLELDGSKEIFVQSERLLAAESNVDFDVALTKRISAGSRRSDPGKVQ